VALVGCLPPEKRDVSDVKVDWVNYAPEVRTRINGEHDCEPLEREIKLAKENDEAQRERFGDGNEDLVMYIEAVMWREGCFDYDP
jgi:hypothetical protein